MVAPRKFENTEVLDSLRDTFWSRGYRATSIQDLERGAKINRSSLYATYGDKTKLFLAALARYGETVSSKAKEILSNSRGSSAISEMLSARARRVVDKKSPEGCLMTRAFIELGDDQGVLGQTLRKNSANAERLITEAVVRAQQQGELEPSWSPQSVARLLIAINHGMCVVHSATGDAEAPKQISEMTIKLLGFSSLPKADVSNVGLADN